MSCSLNSTAVPSRFQLRRIARFGQNEIEVAMQRIQGQTPGIALVVHELLDDADRGRFALFGAIVQAAQHGRHLREGGLRQQDAVHLPFGLNALFDEAIQLEYLAFA